MYMTKQETFHHSFLNAVELEAVDLRHVQAIKKAKAKLLDNFRGKFGRDYFKKYFYSEDLAEIHSDYKYSRDGKSKEDEISAVKPNNKKASFALGFPHVYFTREFKLDSGSLHSTLNIPLFASIAMHYCTREKIYKDIADDILDTAEELLQNAVNKGAPPLTEEQIIQYLDCLRKSAEWMAENTPPTTYRLATGELEPDPPQAA